MSEQGEEMKEEVAADADVVVEVADLSGIAIAEEPTADADGDALAVAVDKMDLKEDEPVADEPKKEGGAREPRHVRRAKHNIEKAVLATGVTGIVKWYNVGDAYGFICRDDTKNDIFVHQTAISKSVMHKPWYRSLDDGEAVMFDVVQGRKGDEAANVSGPEGTTVRGSRFASFHFFTPPWIREARRGRRRSAPSARRRRTTDEAENEGTDKEGGRRRRYYPRSLRAHDKETEEETSEHGEEAKRERRKGRPKKQVSTGDAPSEPKESGEEASGREASVRRRPRRMRRVVADSDDAEKSEVDAPAKEEAVKRAKRRNKPRERRPRVGKKDGGAAGDGPDVAPLADDKQPLTPPTSEVGASEA